MERNHRLMESQLKNDLFKWQKRRKSRITLSDANETQSKNRLFKFHDKYGGLSTEYSIYE